MAKDKPPKPLGDELPMRVERGESGYFVGYCPVLRGCVAQGDTREEAEANLKAAIADYLSVLEEMQSEDMPKAGGARRPRPTARPV